jgi:hypothetical protein
MDDVANYKLYMLHVLEMYVIYVHVGVIEVFRFLNHASK